MPKRFLLGSETGATLCEYVLLLSLMAIVAITSISSLGNAANTSLIGTCEAMYLANYEGGGTVTSNKDEHTTDEVSATSGRCKPEED